MNASVMNIIIQQQHKLQEWRWRNVLLMFVSFTQLVSLIPFTDGFATGFSTTWQETTNMLSTQHQTKQQRPRIITTALQQQSLETSTEEDGNDNVIEPTMSTSSNSYVLQERNPYDVHVYYNGPDQRIQAMELRQKMHTAFGDWMRFYNPKDRPIGPHPLPMWEADFGGYEHRHKWKDVRDFLVQHNCHHSNNTSNTNSENETTTKTTTKPLSILIHPHSVDGDYADHTKHAFWAGEVLELRIQGWRR